MIIEFVEEAEIDMVKMIEIDIDLVIETSRLFEVGDSVEVKFIDHPIKGGTGEEDKNLFNFQLNDGSYMYCIDKSWFKEIEKYRFKLMNVDMYIDKDVDVMDLEKYINNYKGAHGQKLLVMDLNMHHNEYLTLYYKDNLKELEEITEEIERV